jgi:hypothetical protein
MRLTEIAPAFLIISSLLCSCGVSAERASESNASQSAQANSNREQTKTKTDPAPLRAPVDVNKFAIVIAGAGGEEAYTKKFTSLVLQLYEGLTTRLGFAEKNVFLLTESAVGGPENSPRENSARATADEVRKAFASVKSSANAETLVLVVLIGHGSFDSQQAKFNLVGPDLTTKDYSQLLAALPTRRAVFVNCASSSGEFIKPLSGENRIIVTATRSGNEQNATIFAEHFIAGLTDPGADADKNNRVSVLEAFNFATKMTSDWYKEKNRLATEHALIDDNGDGVGHESATAGEGAIAKTTYLDSKAIEQAGGDAELGRLIAERQRLEEAIEKLKARKAEMKPDDYDRELERLLVQLAEVNQTIKSRQK